MIAGGDKYRHTHLCQCFFQSRNAVSGGRTVKQVAGQQNKVAVFILAKGGKLAGNGCKSLFQFFFAQKGGIQVPVSAVEYFNHTDPPFLPSCKGRFPGQW